MMTEREKEFIAKFIVSFSFTGITISIAWFMGIGWAVGSFLLFTIFYND